MDVDDVIVGTLAEAVRELAPVPRQSTWASLSLCILDAVYSIGARYSSTERAVLNVAADAGVVSPIVPCDEDAHADPLPISQFLERYRSGEALAIAAKNRQRTSTRSGILKAEASLRYGAVFAAHGVETLHEARALLDDPEALEVVERKLATVPGEGQYGVRMSYLWMLVGAGDMVKPDRMVLRWLRRNTVSSEHPDGVVYTPEQARSMLKMVQERVRSDGRESFSLWEIDHAIWKAARRR